MSRKFKIEELRLGMSVTVDSLSEIYDTWILLEQSEPTSEFGIIRFIGKVPNEESQKILDSGLIIGCIYNESILLEDVIYNE